jgi:adenylosuccinate lyase
MRENMDRLGGLIHSQRVLLALTQAGLPREAAYEMVQRSAMRVWKGSGDFLSALLDDPAVTAKVAPDALKALFESTHYVQHVDAIFQRVFEES